MKENIELKDVIMAFCEERQEEMALSDELSQKLVRVALKVYDRLVGNNDCPKLTLLEDKLAWDIYYYFLKLDDSCGLNVRYSSAFWAYTRPLGLMTEQEINECLELGLEFYEPIDDDMYYDDTYCLDWYFSPYYDYDLRGKGRNNCYYWINRERK
ncbi:hypothetical protein [Serratia sp. Se-RSBMAAmG]|uniref:hypothetical protein n=1 Tax=Serratia sp. Se-RSBMAAmG TaxID=3043305 RepID=UPI0024AF482F|nr:hypothetical protein [Serratia sp. Se-RSBMAAmG]MDI6976259.1 hypothetical protein [Serratia sp. Se-RSBMAAmG]